MMSPQQLKTVLEKHFNEDELRDLCFDLGFDYELLARENSPVGKARALIQYYDRRGELELLEKAVVHRRPTIFRKSGKKNRSNSKRTFPYRAMAFSGLVLILFLAGCTVFAWIQLRELFSPIAETPTLSPIEPTVVPTVLDVIEEPASPATTSTPNEYLLNELLPSEPSEFSVTLISVEVLPTDMMRWNFEFWNQTSADQRLQFGVSGTYIVDNLGNRYESTFQSSDEIYQAGVKKERYITFPAPEAGATSFTLYLQTGGFSGMQLSLPTYTLFAE